MADQSRDWPEDAAYENGIYLCRCGQCGNRFTGHKRRITCKLCAAASITVAAAQAAKKTLCNLGYTYVEGAELWRPPVIPNHDPCPGCPKGSVCRTLACGRLKKRTSPIAAQCNAMHATPTAADDARLEEALGDLLIKGRAPRYTEWMQLRAKGEWPNGVPDWARDYSGRMNDYTAAQAVIQELAALSGLSVKES